MGTLAGIGAMVGAAQVAAAASWSPLALFAASEQGVWYDPSDFATMFQDSAGTIPVTAATQPVGKILDKSGNNNHATQATAGNRPTLEQDAFGAYYLSFGTTKHLATAAFAFGSAVASIFSGHGQTTTGGTTNPIFSFGDPTAVTGAFWEIYSTNKVAHTRRGSGSFGTLMSSEVVATTVTNVTATVIDLAGTTHATEVPTYRRYGADVAGGSMFGSADTGSGNFGTNVLYLGRVGASYYSGRLYQLVIRAATTLAADIKTAEDYVGTKSGTGPFQMAVTLTPSQFSDSRAPVDRSDYLETSVFAHVDFTTSAMRIEVDVFNNVYTTFATDAEIGVLVDGVDYSTLAPAADGASTHAILLPQGSKTVSLVNGLQSKPTTDVIGTFVTDIRASQAVTQTNLTPSNRIVIYGDSITAGGFAAHSSREGYPCLVRAAASPDSVAVEAWGYRSLYEDCANGTLRAAFVSTIAAYAPSKIWLAIGTNDYGLNKWSAASFGTAYASLLDDLHTALPTATIYCQTPLLRTTETANGSGSTLGDYRTQIGTAQSTRSAYATLVDGTAFMTTASMPDGLHPNTAGHALYGAAVISALGL